MAEHFAEALEFEGKAKELRVYAPKLVPGVLQTKEYAREVLGSGHRRMSDEVRDKLLGTRLERARILDAFNSPEVWAMLDEAVSNRRVVAVGALLVGVFCAAFVAYGLLGGDEPEQRPVPTASVTYDITGKGSASVSYLARSVEGSATVERGGALPWRKTVRVPLGKDPAVSIQLGKRGGEARCALSIRGEHKQRATASGSYGRATCTAELPAKRH